MATEQGCNWEGKEKMLLHDGGSKRLPGKGRKGPLYTNHEAARAGQVASQGLPGERGLGTVHVDRHSDSVGVWDDSEHLSRYEVTFYSKLSLTFC